MSRPKKLIEVARSVTGGTVGETSDIPEEGKYAVEEKLISKLVVSGTANALAFNQLFNSFIMPL